jgi:Sap, sulfolipid-1-addressing protein
MSTSSVRSAGSSHPWSTGAPPRVSGWRTPKCQRTGGISQTNPSTGQYIVDWLFFSIVSLLPLLGAIVLSFVAPVWTQRKLQAVRDWLLHNARTIAAVIIVLLAATLLCNGISGL